MKTNETRKKVAEIKINTDITNTAKMSKGQVRCLVAYFYSMQDNRIRANAKHARLSEREGGDETLKNFADIALENEKMVAKSITYWADNDPMAAWAQKITGIGPILAAGLSSHIDITRSPYASSLWAFAGLPGDCEEKRWKKGKKRPFNAELKKLCFKIGESFIKTQNSEGGVFGQLFVERKKLEWERNLNGLLIDAAKRELERRDWSKNTTGRLFYEGKMSPSVVRKMLAKSGVPEGVKATHVGDEIPMLPPGHINARARRYAVKRFLVHYYEEAYRQHYKKEPPEPYVFEKMGHTHKVDLVKDRVIPIAPERASPQEIPSTAARAKKPVIPKERERVANGEMPRSKARASQIGDIQTMGASKPQ